MNDLRLVELLQDSAANRAELLTLLQAAATLELEQRLAILGVLESALVDENPAIRAAAMRVLGGCNGVAAYTCFGRGLGDADPTVKSATVDAMLKVAELFPQEAPSLMLCLFHTDVEVRRRVCSTAKAFPLPEVYRLPLLADPELREELLAYYCGTSGVKLPFESYPLLQQLREQQSISIAEWRELVLHINSEEIHTPEVLLGVELFLEDDDDRQRLARRLETPGGIDFAIENLLPGCLLAELLNEFWSATEVCRTGLLTWVRTAAGRPGARERIALYLVREFAVREEYPIDLVKLCAEFVPAFCVAPWVPLGVRRAGLSTLGANLSAWRELLPSDARALLVSDVCRDADGGLDLRAVGKVQLLTNQQNSAIVTESFGQNEIDAAIVKHPIAAIDYFSEPVSEIVGRKRIVRELFRGTLAACSAGGALLAWATAPNRYSDTLHDFAELDGGGVGVFAALRQMEICRAFVLSAAQLDAVCERLTVAIPVADWKRFAEVWLQESAFVSLIGARVAQQFAKQDSLALAQVFNELSHELRMRLRWAFGSSVECLPEAVLYTLPENIADSVVSVEQVDTPTVQAIQPTVEPIAEKPKRARAKQSLINDASDPDPLIHTPAIEKLLNPEEQLHAGRIQALRDFLELGTAVNAELRLKVAVYLSSAGYRLFAWPVLVSAPINAPNLPSDVLVAMPAKIVAAVSRGVMIFGNTDYERRLLTQLDQPGVPGLAVEDAFLEILRDASDLSIRRHVRTKLVKFRRFNRLLMTIADTFAWGTRLGDYLLKQRYRITMLVDSNLGYTRFKEKRIYVTTMPIARNEVGGVDVVRGLMLHEYGHHMYHNNPGDPELWEAANAENNGRLLNLVADEHLERNLRSRSQGYGDLLKTLNAYAFQHADQELHALKLLSSLGARAFAVLTQVPLSPSRYAGCIKIGNGQLLKALAENGSSFAQFMRALRMGTGNRTGDARVAQALALFAGKGFARKTMPELLSIARKLREIFGEECRALDWSDPHETMEGYESDWLEHGEGITDVDIQKSVDQILAGKSLENPENSPQRTLNLGPDEAFNTIKEVRKVEPDASAHQAYATRVRRAAQALRQFFDGLGMGRLPERFRIRGRSFDRTRVLSMIVRNDPRILKAREPHRTTDLFIGVLIDCSGSMSGTCIEKARLFATLLAESVKGQVGIDLRFFGFTDQVIYDAGTAAHSAAAALNAGGGNNDAAAMWHAYLEAKRSRRKAKLLVMISDGAPTECTVTALRGIVSRLTRMGYCCAQVGVRPVGHDCFPNFVLLEEDKLDESTKAFGQVVAKLVGKALSLA